MGRLQTLAPSLRATIVSEAIQPIRVPCCPAELLRWLRLLAMTFLLLPSSAIAQEAVNNTADQKDYVSDVLPYPLDAVHDRIAALFDSDGRDYYENYPAAIYDLPEQAKQIDDLSPKAYKRFTAFPLVRASKFYVFYGAYANMQHSLLDFTPYAVMGHSNAALQRYAALPMDARANDFYIWSPDAPYWYSEYTLGDKPVPFHSYFILHLTAADAGHTNVEVIEDQPSVELGRKMSVDKNGIVHHYDIREVEPTTADRTFLISCIRQFMDRKVPARHYFNCKTDAELAEPPPTPFTVP